MEEKRRLKIRFYQPYDYTQVNLKEIFKTNHDEINKQVMIAIAKQMQCNVFHKLFSISLDRVPYFSC